MPLCLIWAGGGSLLGIPKAAYPVWESPGSRPRSRIKIFLVLFHSRERVTSKTSSTAYCARTCHWSMGWRRFLEYAGHADLETTLRYLRPAAAQDRIAAVREIKWY